jgi:RND family efflux transporter MFP subunit
MIGHPHQIMPRVLTWIVVAAWVAASTTAACGRQAAPQAESESVLAVPVVAAPVQVGAIRTVVHAAGTVTAPADAEFLPTVTDAATILEMPRAEGESAAAGDVLVRLDIPSATQNVARQLADVARAQAELENARIGLERTRDVVERGLVPRRDLEIAEREVAAAQDALARAQAAKAAADSDAARSIIRAPFPGVVVSWFHTPGDMLSGIASDPILRFVDGSRLQITVTVPAADAARVAEGASARLAIVTDGPPAALNVASREPSGRGTDFTVRLAFAAPTTLAIDTPVQVDIDAEERANATFVPADAVLREGETTVVYVAAGPRAERRAVTTGLADDVRVEVTSGLAPGELVITQGHIGLADGAAITVDTSAP